MGSWLRHWAKTGHYSDEPAPPPSPSRERRFSTDWRLENAPTAALVPIGIVIGSLMALAFVARLLMLPLELAAGDRDEAEGESHPGDCC